MPDLNRYGRNSRLLIRQQADFDTPEATGQTGKFLALPVRQAIQVDPGRTFTMKTDAGYGLYPQGSNHGTWSPRITTVHPFHYKVLGWLLQAMMRAPTTAAGGGSSTIHTFYLPNTGNSDLNFYTLVVEYDQIANNAFLAYEGAALNSISLDFGGRDREPEISCEWLAKSSVPGPTSYDSAPVAVTETTPPSGWNSGVARATMTTPAECTSATMTISAGLAHDHGVILASPTASHLVRTGPLSVSGTLGLRFTGGEERQASRVLDNFSLTLQRIRVVSEHEALLTVHKAVFTQAFDFSVTDGPAAATANWEMSENGAAEPLTFTIATDLAAFTYPV